MRSRWRLDGPTSIPKRVVVSPLATPWDAGNNDGDGVIAASVGGTECVGLNFIETCGQDIASRTIVRPRFEPDGVTNVVAGSAPAEVTSVRIATTGAEPVSIDTIAFANFPSRFYSTTIPTGGTVSITWLDAHGNEVDSISIDPGPTDGGASG